MNKKYEWRKLEKELYLPKEKPVKVIVPNMKFITINGAGNPNSDPFIKRSKRFTAYPIA